jgi:hypothetical protein
MYRHTSAERRDCGVYAKVRSRCASNMLISLEHSILEAISRNCLINTGRETHIVFILFRCQSNSMDAHLVINLIYPYIEYWPARHMFRRVAVREYCADDLAWDVREFCTCRAAMATWYRNTRRYDTPRDRPYHVSFRRILKNDDTPIFSGFLCCDT